MNRTRRLRAGLLALGLYGCGDSEFSSDRPPSDAPVDDDAAVHACRADAESFVLRTMPSVHGRRPLGSSEVRLLAGVIDALDLRRRDGRREVAAALATGDDYRRRWGSELLDLLRTRRSGHRVLVSCYGERGPAALTPALAQFVRDHPPTEPFVDGPWSMRDLIESSLRADDLRPILRADLLVRMVAPIDDANTSPEDLERSRRTNLGRSFEATYLGRRFECLSCHRDDASVTDDPDPALDRFWPVAQGLEHAVYPVQEEQLHAVFRWEGFADGNLSPWGAAGCGSFSTSHDPDPFPSDAQLGGEFPAGAHALDLQERLDRGFDRLATDGWSLRPHDGAQALAQLVVLHLCDGIWASVTGHRLTLDHGTPRNRAQAERLRSLAITLVDSNYSLRALLVEIAVDPHLDQATPADCELDGPEPLPAIFEPFAEVSPEVGPSANGIGHAVHRRDPFALDDEAHRILGRALPGQITGQPGFDAQRVGPLGAYLRESQPGHDGLDLLGALVWEQALEAIPSAPAASGSTELTVTLDDLIAEARADPTIVVGDLMLAIKDRILADPTIDTAERPLVEDVVELAWDRPVHEVSEPALRDAAYRYARVLLATPQFLLAGLPGSGEGPAPRLRPAGLDPMNLCEQWAPRLLAGEQWWCTDQGLALP